MARQATHPLAAAGDAADAARSGRRRGWQQMGILGLAGCCWLPGVAFALCTPSPELAARINDHPDARTYAELGTWYGDQGKLDCAAEAFRSALNLDPNSAPVNYMLGLSLVTGGHPDDAIVPLQHAALLAPGESKPHLLLGAALSQLRRNDEAKAEWETALGLDPQSTMALDGLAKSLIAEGDYASVVDHLQNIQQDENLALDLSVAYTKMGMVDEAISTLTAAVKASPESMPLTGALVALMVRQTRYQDASALAKNAAELHPGDVNAQVLYLRVLVLNGDRDIARPLAARLLASSPHNPDVLYLNGILERQAAEYPAARAHLEEAAALEPDYYNVHYNLGAVLAKLQDPKGAREQFEKALQLGAVEPEVRFDLATALRALGETQLAQEQLKLYQQELKDAASRTLAAGKSAEAAQAMTSGDAAKAAALYREAVDALPDNAMLSYKLALALDRAGDVAGERVALEQTVKVKPDFALAQNQLGYLDSQAGDAGAAEGHFKAALQAAPGYTQAWISLAANLGMQARFPEAQEALANALKLDPQNSQALELDKALASARAQAQK